MSNTFHHDQKRWRPPRRVNPYDGWLHHAPGWFRHVLNRLYRHRANREVARYGEVRTKKAKDPDWEWW